MSELRIIVLIWTLVLLMAVGAALGARRRSGALVLALVSFVWLLVDSDFEGVVLIVVTKRNGLTTSDLVGVAGLVLALGQWWRLAARARRDLWRASFTDLKFPDT